MRKIAGVDIGGTNIKLGIVDEENGEILNKMSFPTCRERKPEEIFDEIILSLNKLGDFETIGIGVPGSVDNEKGIVVFANNMDWHKVEIAKYFAEKTGFRPSLINDADAACCAEVNYGAAKDAKNAVIITLGTGIGSGFIVNGKLLKGMGGAGELGHMVINTSKNSPKCTCGRSGCFEVFASATGLINLAKNAVEKNPKSLMSVLFAQKGGYSARVPFIAARQNDQIAVKVVEDYLDYLSTGIANVVNIFQPEFIGLAGGVANEDEEFLLKPLIKLVQNKSYGSNYKGIIATCKVKEPGIVGAAIRNIC